MKFHQNPIKRDVSHSTSTRGHFGIDLKSMGQMTWRLLKKRTNVPMQSEWDGSMVKLHKHQKCLLGPRLGQTQENTL